LGINVRKLFGLATTYVCLGQGRALYTPTYGRSIKKRGFSWGFLRIEHPQRAVPAIA
jgi:hypothetical protein